MRFYSLLLDLVFPPRCVFCRGRIQDEDTQEMLICKGCLAATLDPGACCHRCSYPLDSGGLACQACSGQRFAFSGACAVNLYQGNVKKVVHRYKYAGHKYLAGTLGKLVARQVRRSAWWQELMAVVPVPLHPKRLQERRFDQALLLAQVIGDELELPVKRALVRVKPTPSQTRLGSKERWRNVENAFQKVPECAVSGNILLVDDLLTTGATAHYAARALLEAGASSVYLAVIGR